MTDKCPDPISLIGQFQETVLPVLLTIPEAAKILRVSRTTAFLMARRHEIPSLRIGERVMVPASHLAAWIEERVVTPEVGIRLVGNRRTRNEKGLRTSVATQAI